MNKDVKPVNGACSRRLFKRCNRLCDRDRINHIFEDGAKFVGRFLILLVQEGRGVDSRLAAVAGSKMFPNAVERNRMRRVMREIFRLNKHLLNGPCDIILVARAAVRKAIYREIENDFLQLAEKAGLLKS